MLAPGTVICVIDYFHRRGNKVNSSLASNVERPKILKVYAIYPSKAQTESHTPQGRALPAHISGSVHRRRACRSSGMHLTVGYVTSIIHTYHRPNSPHLPRPLSSRTLSAPFRPCAEYLVSHNASNSKVLMLMFVNYLARGLQSKFDTEKRAITSYRHRFTFDLLRGCVDLEAPAQPPARSLRIDC